MHRRPFASCIVACAVACELANDPEPTPEPTPTAQVAVETPRPAQSVTFDRLEITTTNKRNTNRRWVNVEGLAKIHEKLPEDAHVTAKLSCTGASYVLADVTKVQSKHAKLQRYDVGETADFHASFFFNAAPGALVPCQVDFAVDRPAPTELGSACWRGDDVTDGPCVPAIAPKPDATAPAFAVHDFVVLGGGKLDVTYMVRINQSPHPRVELGLEAACNNFGMPSRLVDRESIEDEPVGYAAGDSVVRTAELAFLDSKFEKGEGGSPCDFTLWMRTKAEPAEVVLGEWCRRDGVLAEGTCGEAVPTPAATTLDRESFAIPKARLVAETHGKSKAPLVRIDAFVRREKATVERVAVQAKVTCKVGDERRVETVRLYGTDPTALRPGESTSVSGTAFSEPRLAGVPQWCEAIFVAGETKTPTLEIGAWCMRDTTTAPGPCETK